MALEQTNVILVAKDYSKYLKQVLETKKQLAKIFIVVQALPTEGITKFPEEIAQLFRF